MSKQDKRGVVGQLRPSQLLFTFGVGSLLDLPHMSVLVMGLDDWNADPAFAREITEDRLLGAVRGYLGPQVQKLCAPPHSTESNEGLRGPVDTASVVGIPVAPFPRWMRCPRCDLLAPMESGLFSLKVDRYHPDRTAYVHSNCPKSAKPPNVLPVRFLVACKNGHLDDFPWVSYVHGGSTCEAPILRYREFGASGGISDIVVKCEACGRTRNMDAAFGPEADHKCRSRRPHLRDFESNECTENAKAILLGASNSWFPASLSALSIPSGSNRLAQLVDENWVVLGKANSPDIIEAFRQIGQLPAMAGYSVEEIWTAVQDRRQPTPVAEVNSPVDLKVPEWETFSNPSSAPSAADFQLREVDPPATYEPQIDSVVLVERLREVRALIGFTRIEAPPDVSEVGNVDEARRAPLIRKSAKWVPAVQVKGEGVFIKFSESAVKAWCNKDEVSRWEQGFLAAHREWRRVRRIEPEEAGFPGARFILIHTFAHALMSQLTLECGYSAASVRERIYAAEPSAPGGPAAGVMIYTAASDSEGTLGGLVSLGTPTALQRHIDRALQQVSLCASDPLCSEHTASSEGLTLHGAACHACIFAPETSCERGNRYLDRAVLVPTFSTQALAYFTNRGQQ